MVCALMRSVDMKYSENWSEVGAFLHWSRDNGLCSNTEYWRKRKWQSIGEVSFFTVVRAFWTMVGLRLSEWGTAKTDWGCNRRCLDPGITGRVLVWSVGVRRDGNRVGVCVLILWSTHGRLLWDANCWFKRRWAQTGGVRFVAVIQTYGVMAESESHWTDYRIKVRMWVLLQEPRGNSRGWIGTVGVTAVTDPTEGWELIELGGRSRCFFYFAWLRKIRKNRWEISVVNLIGGAEMYSDLKCRCAFYYGDPGVGGRSRRLGVIVIIW